MSTEQTPTDDSPRPPKPSGAPDQVEMALERTYLAHERTLMAWVRTATSLVTFGFSIYKFFEFAHSQTPEKFPFHVLGPKTLGMLMIGIGVTTLTLATVQHYQSMKHLRIHYKVAAFSPALLLALLMSVLGILALVSPFLRH